MAIGMSDMGTQVPMLNIYPPRPPILSFLIASANKKDNGLKIQSSYDSKYPLTLA